MLKDRQLIFGLLVGFIATCLGIFVLQVNAIGWSLMAVGIAVAGMAIVSYQMLAKPVFVEVKKEPIGIQYALAKVRD